MWLQNQISFKRNRIVCFIMALSTIVSGLLSRKFSFVFPTWINTYLGDALWAIMIFLIVGFLFPSKKTVKIAVYSLVFCYLIETSQLYHAQWIDAIRNIKLGGLILGFGFQWTDMVSYFIGILLAATIEYITFKTLAGIQHQKHD